VKELKSHKNKEREYLIDEESSEYWDEHDASEVLERGEKIKLEIAKPDYRCTTCGSSRIRKRIIDLPIVKGTVVLKRTKILFCADCKTSIIEKESLEKLRDKLHLLTTKLDTKTVFDLVKEGLVCHEQKWTEKAKERKVISIYFPTKEEGPAKAQISLPISDPLYPKIRSLTSEDVRKMLGLEYFEDLVIKAKDRDRTISQYLKIELAKKILDDSSKPNVHPEVRILTVIPRKVNFDFLQKTRLEPLSLAAKSDIDKEIIFLGAPNQEFEGILHYDYGNAALFIEVLKDNIGLSVFDAEMFVDDKNVVSSKDLKVEDNRILLLSKTRDISEDVSKIVLKLKQ